MNLTLLKWFLKQKPQNTFSFVKISIYLVKLKLTEPHSLKLKDWLSNILRGFGLVIY